MNKTTSLYVSIIFSIMIIPRTIFANESSYSIEENLIDPNIIVDRFQETASARMNRQAAAISNTRSNSNQNRDEQIEESSWETASERMNRQAIDAANTRANSNWIRID